MARLPSLVVFDVNETLSDMGPMAERFRDVGAPAHLAQLWFAALLRDGFALAAAGGHERFAVLAREVLHDLLTGLPLKPDLNADLKADLDVAVEHVLAGFASLRVHPDVPEGVRDLHA